MAMQANMTADFDDGAAKAKLSALHAFDLFTEVNRREDIFADQLVICWRALLTEHDAAKKQHQRPEPEAGNAVGSTHSVLPCCESRDEWLLTPHAKQRGYRPDCPKRFPAQGNTGTEDKGSADDHISEWVASAIDDHPDRLNPICVYVGAQRGVLGA